MEGAAPSSTKSSQDMADWLLISTDCVNLYFEASSHCKPPCAQWTRVDVESRGFKGVTFLCAAARHGSEENKRRKHDMLDVSPNYLKYS